MTLEEALAKITALEAEKATLTTTIADKDAIIADKDAHLQEKGEQFKKFRDMTAAEKELLSEKEIELLKRQDALEEIAKKTSEDQANFRKEQRDSVKNALINKMARGDAELAKKIEFNLNKIKDSDTAMTEEALAPLVTDSFNMLGNQVPDAIRQAHNTGGQLPNPEPVSNGFADSQAGKDLSKALFGADAPLNQPDAK